MLLQSPSSQTTNSLIDVPMKFIAIIPARYASTRFPAKPLAWLAGKPIVQHVYERVSQVIADTFVATDDERIFAAVEKFGGKAIMTSTEHRSGTDRCYEAACKLNMEYDVVINVQGDEPFIAASQLHALMDCFENRQTQIATLVKPFALHQGWEALSNPNSPKVVIDEQGFALYFSRSVIPFLRGVPETEWLAHHTFYKHIGIYAYRKEALHTIQALPQSRLEIAESLEQLRWLEAGLKIRVGQTEIETIGIDTPEDLQKAEIFLARQA